MFHEYFIDSLRIRGRLFALTPGTLTELAVRQQPEMARSLAIPKAGMRDARRKSRFQIGIKFISNCVYNSIKTSGLLERQQPA